MLTCFGFSLLENVEKQCAPLTDAEKRLHLAYMCETYRIMGMAFSEKRDLMEAFSRAIEAEHGTHTMPAHQDFRQRRDVAPNPSPVGRAGVDGYHRRPRPCPGASDRAAAHTSA